MKATETHAPTVRPASNDTSGSLCARERFLFGGLGALMPVLVAIVSLDLAKIFADGSNFTMPQVAGIGIRYVCLFLLGGLVSYLHSDEHKPFKLFEIGIAAPALVASIVAANAAKPATSVPVAWGLPLISAAHAEGPLQQQRNNNSVWSEVIKGVTGTVYQQSEPPAPIPVPGAWRWLLSADGKVPSGAFKAVDGQAGRPQDAVHICRAQYKGGVHPGRIAARGSDGCVLGWGGKDHMADTYEVLMGSSGHWLAAADGRIPAGALIAGHERGDDGTPLYVCRAKTFNGMYPGKASPQLQGCLIVDSGVERRERKYEVLVD